MLQRQGRIKLGASSGRARLKADTEDRVWWQEAWAEVRCTRLEQVEMSKIANNKRLRLENWV